MQQPLGEEAARSIPASGPGRLHSSTTKEELVNHFRIFKWSWLCKNGHESGGTCNLNTLVFSLKHFLNRIKKLFYWVRSCITNCSLQ